MEPVRGAPVLRTIVMECGRPRNKGERWLARGPSGALLLAALAFACPPARAQTAVGGFSSLSGTDSKQPIDIESDQLEVDDKRHMAVFSGNVSATQGENNLKAPRLEVFYDSRPQETGTKAAGTVKAASGPADPMSGGQIKHIHAMGGKVVVTSGKDPQELTGDDALFDVNAQLITMTGKEVVLSQGLSKVRGPKLLIDLKTGRANLVTGEEGASVGATGNPRIRASLSNTDSKQPIDIESNQLEVDDKRHMAVFSGSVSATQGENNLKAPRLEVFYDSKPQETGTKAAGAVKAAGGPADPMSSGQIKHIHAAGGKVVVTSGKDQQEVTGDDAKFDVKAQLITMAGKEVVLSQGLSKVKGTKLVFDLKTGRANLITGEEGVRVGASSKPRVQAVFQQQTGPDGKLMNPLASLNPESKKAPPADPKKNTGAAAHPAKKTVVPPKENASQPEQDWQTQSR